MEKQLVIVTGGSGGIGSAISKILALNGYKVCMNFRSNKERAEKVESEIKKESGDIFLSQFDITDRESVDKAIDEILDKHGVPYGLVNNAGYHKDELMMWMKDENWKDVIDVNLNGFFYITRKVVFTMMKERRGRIINISSTAGQAGLPGQVNYSAAKAGINGATKSLAMETAKRNILVNSIAPGFIKTEMLEGNEDKLKERVPLGRIGEPEDVAYMVEFLLSRKASYITGQTFSINGGIYM